MKLKENQKCKKGQKRRYSFVNTSPTTWKYKKNVWTLLCRLLIVNCCYSQSVFPTNLIIELWERTPSMASLTIHAHYTHAHAHMEACLFFFYFLTYYYYYKIIRVWSNWKWLRIRCSALEGNDIIKISSNTYKWIAWKVSANERRDQ